MSATRWARALTVGGILILAGLSLSCDGGSCGLGIHDRVTVTGNVPCCGGAFRDVMLTGNGDASFQLASTAHPTAPGLVDAFLVNTTCAQLFNGPYPGSSPLCQVLIGPTAPGKVSSLAALSAGTYRVWLQTYSTNASTDLAPYLIDVEIWDRSCRSPLL
jgi:hypothetical protein